MQQLNVYSLSKFGHQALTLGLLRGLEERPVDAPLTERDLGNRVEVKGLSANKEYEQREAVCNACVLAYYMYLWLCAAESRALRGGVGDPCSVTLSTSRLFLSGRQRPWRVSIGESTRFRGGSAVEHRHKVMKG